MHHARIYWDTNVFVALRETEGIENQLLWGILATVKDKAIPFQTSLLTFSELKVKPLQLKDAELLADYESWSYSSNWLEVCPVGKSVLEGAALLRAQRRSLKLPDAIHLATALHLRCAYFLTADHGIQDVSELEHPSEGLLDIRPLTVIRPDESTLRSLMESLSA